MSSSSSTDPSTSKTSLRARDILLRQDIILLGVFAVMVAFFTAMNPAFLTTFSIANVLQDWAPVMLLAIGETYVIITGGIDLSVGSTLGLSGVACAMTMRHMNSAGDEPTLAIAAGIAVALAVGVLVGLINGLLITRSKLAPFIATLATLGASGGITLVLTDGVQIAGGPRQVIQLGNATYLQVLTAPLIVVVAVLAVSWIVLGLTRFGRWTYAIGSNRFAARAAGIDVQRHLLKIYALSGLLAGVAGAFVYIRLGSGSPTSGHGQELAAIAAAVIGGTSLFGGSGRMSGTLLGALITTSVLSGLILIGVAPNWQQVVIGVLIAVAVGVMQINVGRTRSGTRKPAVISGPASGQPVQADAGEVTLGGHLVAMPKPPIYEARHINKSYGSVVALQDVDFQISAGEIVGLVGDNGAGKSTLVKVLSGAHSPDSGELLLDGQPRTWRSPHDALDAGIETLYQDSGLCPDLTVDGNIFLGRERLKPALLGRLGFVDNRAMSKVAQQELENVGIGLTGIRRTVSQLSGGQRQAVAIGRAVAWARKVIVLDEPTNHLGARQSMEVLRVMLAARSRGLGVVFISHTLPHVLAVTDRIVVLRLGRVVADEPTSAFTPDSLLKVITGLSTTALSA